MGKSRKDQGMSVSGHWLTRRGFWVAAGGLVVASKAWPANPTCTLTPEQEEGPYYIDDATIRREISEGKQGVPLLLRIALVNSKSCEPIGNAALDIWHCDAMGVYSGFTSQGGGEDGRGGPPGRGGPGFGPPGGRGPGGRGRGPGGNRQVDETRFLRGVQVTDARGTAEFATIYPGWYAGRTIHIHVKVHTANHVSHTGQFFLPEDITEQIAKLEPYVKHTNVHRITHEEDHVFGDQHGSESM